MDKKKKKNSEDDHIKVKSDSVVSDENDNGSSSGMNDNDDRIDDEISEEALSSDTENKTEPEDDRVLQLQDTIKKLEEELSRTRDSMLRKAAEFENLKKRTHKEKALIFDDAKADAITRFLPVREDLKRSLEASAGSQNYDKGFLDGVKLVLSNFDRILDELNVHPIEETGVPFDVDQHDALLSQPANDDSIESNTVLQILEPGYKIGDRVIKHARVIVSQ